ncbi:MAG: branched-chain amino acid ABC transporter permease [Shinella zoogloeoides]|uniref:branched-chain amino acid ABC transporter permease n=1 Tax=Shinella zoogloeoides TaxID=352475 RepID=UPI003C783FA2
MELFIQYTINALSLGGTYALLALGLAIVFSLFGFINFAHGEIMTVCAYAIYFALSLGCPFGVAVLVGLAAAVCAAVAMERIAFRPLRGADPTTLLVTGFALSGALQILFQIVFGSRGKPVVMPDIFTGAISIGGVYIGIVQIVSIVVVLCSVILLNLFLNRTKFGLSLLASAEDFNVARLMGIRANAVFAGAFAISGLLAGIAAVLWLAQRGSVDPTLGFTPLVKAFVATIIGGMGSLVGAVAGGFFLGFLEILLQAVLPSKMLIFRDPLVLMILIGFLLFRPGGLVLARAQPIR